MPAFSSVFRVLVGVVLLVAAAAQHRDPPGRRLDAIDRYRMVPRPLQPACLAVLTGAEILLGAALIAGAHRVVTCIAGACCSSASRRPWRRRSCGGSSPSAAASAP